MPSDLGAMSRFGTIILYNNTGSTWERGDFIVMDPNDDASVAQADALVIDHYDSPTASVLPTGEPLGTGNDTIIGGVALEDVPDGQAGILCVFGACLAKVAETGDDAAGTAYGAGATSGQLSEITPGSAGAPVLAKQIGQSGTTTSGDLRRVFVHTLYGLEGAGTDSPNPLGAT